MLDDLELAEDDPHGMSRLIAEYPTQFQHALTSELPPTSGIRAAGLRRVVFLGMGGSGAGASFAQQYMDAHGGLPSHVVRDYDIPDWVDADTFVVATSYSGNTEETLAALADCIDRGASWVAITSGGRLAEAAKKHGAPLAQVPGGSPPRAAFGHLTVTAMRLLAAVGLVDTGPLQASLDVALQECRRIADRCAIEVSVDDNPAKRMANVLHHRRVLLVADTPFEPCAERIRCQLNENSKAIAFTRILPEANHNDTVSWSVGEGVDGWAGVWVGPFDRNPALKVRAEFVREMITSRGIPTFDLDLDVKDPLARSLAVSYMGDWISLYLAFLHDQDPTDVDVIGVLKDRCAQTGLAREGERRLGLDGAR